MPSLQYTTSYLSTPVRRFDVLTIDRNGTPFYSHRCAFDVFSPTVGLPATVAGKEARAWARRLGLPTDRLEWHARPAVNAKGETVGTSIDVVLA